VRRSPQSPRLATAAAVIAPLTRFRHTTSSHEDRRKWELDEGGRDEPSTNRSVASHLISMQITVFEYLNPCGAAVIESVIVGDE
jgi:hypothetical protein